MQLKHLASTWIGGSNPTSSEYRKSSVTVATLVAGCILLASSHFGHSYPTSGESSDVFLIKMADEPLSSSSIVRHIRDLNLPTLE